MAKGQFNQSSTLSLVNLSKLVTLHAKPKKINYQICGLMMHLKQKKNPNISLVIILRGYVTNAQ